MSDGPYLAAGIAVAAGITFALRGLPFLMKNRIGESRLLADVGRWMPLGAIAILLVYCLEAIDFGASSHGVPELAGVAATVAVHLRWRNAVASIVAGTTVCLVLANVVFTT